jgi:hypothetical protein
VRDRLDELGTETEVVVVTFTKPEHLDGYLAMNDLPFAVLIDSDRAGYHAFGLGRGSLLRVWGTRAAWRYLQLCFQGKWRNLRRPTEDTRQLGGDFIVDAEGVLVYGFWGKGPDDRPGIDELIAAIP